MFKLRLNAKHCISCGICMDVCAPNAIAMRAHRSSVIEGGALSYVYLRSASNNEVLVAEMLTFPYLAIPDRCDGCMVCVKECPTLALELPKDDHVFCNS